MSEERDDKYYIPPTLGEVYRNRAALGDLPRSLAFERREQGPEGRGQIPPGSGPGSRGAVADLARPTDIVDFTETHTVNPRPPALLYQVVSTYDSRPIQGYDFQSSSCNAIDFFDDGASGNFDPVSHFYEVPPNVVAVVREFRYQVAQAPVNHVTEGDCWLQSDVLVNDLPVREYNQMVHPVMMINAFPMFLIVDELETIELRLSLRDPANTVLSQAIDGIQSPVLFELYGNLLVKTGVPIQFEIANAIGGGVL